MRIPGFQFIETLHESKQTLVGRALREDDRRKVVIKMSRSSHPTRRELERLRHEFAMARLVDDPGVVRMLELGRWERRIYLVLEDFGAVSLRGLLREKRCGPMKFLELAPGITRALSALHARGIIHKDIKPHNIMVHPETGDIKLTDLGIASRLDREDASPSDLGRFEGTLAYISPEQTSRMNRAVDYRTDFYSLGATFFEILTGRRVFEARDPLELIHCHIALEPERPETIAPEVPVAISRIVMKLLSKNAEDRYQSSAGILHDLRECTRFLRETGTLPEFEIGRRDVPEKFRLPQKLYGREAQTSELLERFELACDGASEILMVSGYSGIGKSALVNEVNKPIAERRGIFLAGKYDQYKRNIPYSALIDAFRVYLRQVLAEEEVVTLDWRERLLRALGPNGRVIIEVVPEVELLIGAQPPVPDLDPAEARNRFNLVFKDFVATFARAEHPLALFIDDLQWADPPTLKFMQDLMQDPGIGHLLFIGAYRDNEVDAEHPLTAWLRHFEKAGRPAGAIRLEALGDADVNRLVADTLYSTAERARPLAELVVAKTHGNPFFVGQFLKTLYIDKLIWFDAESSAWTWKMERITDLGITDNVVELMTGRILHLSDDARQVLRHAAFLGNQFQLHTLAIILGRSASEITGSLEEVLISGMIRATGETRPQILAGADEPENHVYRFLHDRVQQAAYSAVEAGAAPAVHLRVGRLLLEHSRPEEVV